MEKRNRKNTRQRRQIELFIKTVLFFIAIIIGVNVFSDLKEKNEAEKQARIEQEALEAEQNLIEETLSKDKYEEELRDLYEKYPQIKEILLNREEYEDWLIEYMIKSEEAVDWVVDYPAYMEKTEEELENIALEEIEAGEEERNHIPLLFQWDKRWGYLEYGTGPIAVEGCGPVCLSMVAVGLTGDGSLTPKAIADFSVENGHYVEGEGTSWSLMDVGARKLGLESEQIMEWTTIAVKNRLKEGKPIICSVGPGDFTSQGHFIVIVKLNEDGTVVVNDPNSLANSEKTWEIQDILEQAKGMWALSAS